MRGFEEVKIETVDTQTYEAFMRAYQVLDELSAWFKPLSVQRLYEDPLHGSHLAKVHQNIEAAIFHLLEYSASFRKQGAQ